MATVCDEGRQSGRGYPRSHVITVPSGEGRLEVAGDLGVGLQGVVDDGVEEVLAFTWTTFPQVMMRIGVHWSK
jgi:hypothetical protein